MTKTFEYKLDGQKYNVEIVYKNNKNTYIKIKDDLTIYVTTSFLTPKYAIKQILNENKEFLRKTLNKVNQRSIKEKDFYYLGTKYDIILVPFENVDIDNTKIYVKNNLELDKWLKKQTQKVFQERLDICYQKFEEKIPFPKLKIRKMKTRWGVNHKKDNSITLNAKLIRYDLFVIDYVIIHELSHFVHFDHSKNFWNTVSKYMPDYKKAVKALKE